MIITGDTFIEDIVERYPELIAPLMEHNIVCIRCGEPVWGTLGEQMREKGIDDPDALVNELNRILKGSK